MVMGETSINGVAAVQSKQTWSIRSYAYNLPSVPYFFSLSLVNIFFSFRLFEYNWKSAAPCQKLFHCLVYVCMFGNYVQRVRFICRNNPEHHNNNVVPNEREKKMANSTHDISFCLALKGFSSGQGSYWLPRHFRLTAVAHPIRNAAYIHEWAVFFSLLWNFCGKRISIIDLERFTLVSSNYECNINIASKLW